MSDPVGKYTDDDLNTDSSTQNANADQRQGEFTDTETVSEAHTSEDGHTHTEHEHTVNGETVNHTATDDGQTRDGQTRDLNDDGVGDGELDVEDRTERHS